MVNGIHRSIVLLYVYLPRYLYKYIYLFIRDYRNNTNKRNIAYVNKLAYYFSGVHYTSVLRLAWPFILLIPIIVNF